MKKQPAYLIQALLIAFLFPAFAGAQCWEFIKEKDGIRMYTRQDAGKSLKSYKGITDIKAPSGQIYAMIEDINHTGWWDKSITQMKVFLYEKDKRAQYYLVYDLPWPVTDRDLCVDVKVTRDPVTGEDRITAIPLVQCVPEKSEMIRIRDYRQTWTVKPAGSNLSHVELEGYVDPAGSVPDWLSNMMIVDSPYKVISDLKRILEKN